MNLLADILESNQKSTVLAFLLLSTERSYSAKELTKRLHLSEKVLSNVLEEFEKLSLVYSFERGKETLYIINQKHKLLPEIRLSLVKNQKPYEDELFSAIKKLGEIQGAFLSGAFTGQPQLPVDILLVGKISLTRLEIFLQNCKKMLGIEVNYSIMTPDEFQMRRDTFDRFLKDVFDYRHLVVVDGTLMPRKGKK
ncbi:MAG: hypothetical protein M3Q64_01695 [bacterium]|nr:hypothetical protein [bacterium]